MQVKLSSLSNEQKSRWICEKLGYRFGTAEEFAPEYSDRRLGQVWWFEGAPYSEAELPCVGDPGMTVMLLEKLRGLGNVALCGDNGWGVTVTFIDENGNHISYTDPARTNSATIGQAVADAFMLSQGYEDREE